MLGRCIAGTDGCCTNSTIYLASGVLSVMKLLSVLFDVEGQLVLLDEKCFCNNFFSHGLSLFILFAIAPMCKLFYVRQPSHLTTSNLLNATVFGEFS